MTRYHYNWRAKSNHVNGYFQGNRKANELANRGRFFTYGRVVPSTYKLSLWRYHPPATRPRRPRKLVFVLSQMN